MSERKVEDRRGWTKPGGNDKDPVTGRYVEGCDTSWHDGFITFYSEYPYIGKACQSVGINKVTYYDHMRRFPEFAERVAQARIDSVENLRYVAHVKALSTSPFLLFKLMCAYDERFRRAVSTHRYESTLTIKFSSEDLFRLASEAPEIVHLAIGNKMNEAQLAQVLSEAKYKHLLPAASGAAEEEEREAIDLEPSAEEGIFEINPTLLDESK